MIELETERDVLLRIAKRIGISPKRLASASTASISEMIAEKDRKGISPKPRVKEVSKWEKILADNDLGSGARQTRLSHDTIHGGGEYREQVARETRTCPECGSGKLSWVEGVEDSSWFLRCQHCGTDAAVDCDMSEDEQ
jgi:DNA-directed RNA polymerase subunit M/transcription elongation factor TFIIS